MIFYFLNSTSFVESKKNFNHFSKLVKKNNKNSKIIFSSSGSVYGPCFKKKNLAKIQK